MSVFMINNLVVRGLRNPTTLTTMKESSAMNIYSHLYPQIFLTNKYTRWYLNIILSANNQNRKKSKKFYYEKHHIIPDSMFMLSNRKRKNKGHLLGNPNDSTNLVLLTAREHFICHMLLCKMMVLPHYKFSMSKALVAMSMKSKNTKDRNYTITSKQYEIIKKNHSAVMKDAVLNDAFIKQNKTNCTCEFCGLLVNKINHDKWHGKNCLQNPSVILDDRPKNNLGKTWVVVDHKLKGYKQSSEHIASRKNKPKSQCIHCGKRCNKTNYKKWHGDNCKLNPDVDLLARNANIGRPKNIVQTDVTVENNF